MRRSLLLSAVLGLSLLLLLAPPALAQSRAAAPAGGAPAEGTIPGRYIVTLVDGADPSAVAREYRARGADVDHVYRAALRGFAGAIPAREVERLRADERVERVEADGSVTTTATTQTNATWGLDRVDQRALPLDGSYSYGTTAANVTAYVIDTGIRASHVDFGGRVAGGFSAIDDRRGTDDCNGHGTHVAGTIGGATWGVAKAVQLVPVRVLDCRGSGTWSGVIAGVDWVTANAVRPAVANMSLGGGANDSVDAAVRNSIAAGLVYALAAGNDSGADACGRSPARVTEGLTVGATTETDARASYSNIGPCLDLFAPGSSITSAWDDSDTATHTISGTSMATPHVAGAAALYLSANDSASVGTVNAAIVGNATEDVVTGAGTGSPNLLLHSLLGVTETLTKPAAPTDLAARAVSSSQIDLTWTDVANEDSYRLVAQDGAGAVVLDRTLAQDATSFSHTELAATSTYRYQLTATNSAGTSDPATTSATTLEPASEPDPGAAPVAAFVTTCSGATCDVDGSASTNTVTWSWSFDPADTDAYATVTFTSPGTYSITLTVDDGAGSTDSTSRTVSCGWSGKGRNKALSCTSP